MIPDGNAGPHPALGIDFGEARVGVAATDALGILAHPVETIEVARVDPLARIPELAGQRGIRTLVVGLPLRMDGSEGTAAGKARKFAEALGRRLPGLPLVMVDEALTTRDAADLLRQSGRKSRHQKDVIDRAAAVEILKRWMDPHGTALDQTPDGP